MILRPRLLSAREDQGAEVISQIAVEFLLLSDGPSHISSFTAFASVDFKNGRRDKNENRALTRPDAINEISRSFKHVTFLS